MLRIGSGKRADSVLESFYGRPQRGVSRWPYRLPIKRNCSALVRVGPLASCPPGRPEGNAAVHSDGQDVGVKESVMGRAEEQAVPGI
jgi:hypothetical protein